MATNQGHFPGFVSGSRADQVNFPQRGMRCHPPADELIEATKAFRNKVGVPVVIFRVLKRNAHDLARRHFCDLSTRSEVIAKRSLGDDNMNRGFSQRPDRARQTEKENRNESLHWDRSASEEYRYLRAVRCYGPLLSRGRSTKKLSRATLVTCWRTILLSSELAKRKSPAKAGHRGDYWPLALQAAEADVPTSLDRKRS